MAVSRTSLMGAALAVLAACTTMPASTVDAASPAGVYAGRSVLDTAIDAAGGADALSKVKELYWTGDAKVTTPDKVIDLAVASVVRPDGYGRFSSWPKADGPKKARTLQVELGRAWDINHVVWNPLPDAQAKNENQQVQLYKMMLLTSLKSADAVVKEQPVAADGTRAIQATLNGLMVAFEFDASGKLVRAGNSVADPAGGPDIAQVATFTGQVESNGVKWPKHIAITQNGKPFFDVEIATFEALPQTVVRPMEQSMQYDPSAVKPGAADAG